MFYYVNGTVAETGPNLAVIDCGGVGYACATTNYTLSQLKRVSAPSCIPISMSGRKFSSCMAFPPRRNSIASRCSSASPA